MSKLNAKQPRSAMQTDNWRGRVARSRRLSLFFIACLCGFGERVQAAESGSGVYLLGLRGPGAGLTPPEGVYLSVQSYFYDGRIAGRLPVGDGEIAARARAMPAVLIPTLLWMTPFQLGNARLGLSVTAPFGRADLTGQVGPFPAKAHTFNFADPSVSAFLGGREGAFNWQAGMTGFVPIGDYQEGELANVARHRSAGDLYGALTYLDPTFGLDVSHTVGITFNAPNDVTHYQTGTEFHWEWSVSKKFANGLSLGPAGYFYQQLNDDTGAGAAILGPFKGEVVAVGATLGYDFKLGAMPISARLRYYHEVDAKYRLKGDAGFVSVNFPLWVAGHS